MEWKTSEPPLNQRIEYQRDDHKTEVGLLSAEGAESVTPHGEAQEFKPLFSSDNGEGFFQVLRWREIAEK